MGKRTLESLAKLYYVEDYFDFICQAWLNGEKKLAMNLFNDMKSSDKKDFMNELNYCTFMRKFGDGPWQMDFLHEIIYSLKM